ncbi:hypothetical protein Ctob_016684, partial [Chrysochromulina tobinii]
MARAAETLTIPMTVYVDDLAATGATAKGTTSRMAKFQDWAENVCGVQFKRIKDKSASQVQLFLGLWWDSFTGTRTLEERKLVQYMDMLLEFSIKFDCLIRFFWLKSEDNSMADPLSREDGLEAFLAEVQRQAFVVPPAVIQGMPDAGRVRNLDMSAPFNAADMEVLQGQSRQRVDMAALSRMLPAVVFIQSMLRGWLVRRDLGRFAPPRGTAFGILARAYLPEKTPEKAP